MKTSWVSLGAAILTWLIAPVSLGHAQSEDEVVARMGSIVLRSAELRRAIAAMPPETRRQLLMSTDGLDRFARTEIFRLALLAEARSQAWDKRPDVLAMMDRGRDQALVTAYADSIAQPPASYPNEDEIAVYYLANAERFVAPKRLKVARIVFDKGDDPGAARRRAEDAGRLARERGTAWAEMTDARTGKVHAADGASATGWESEAELPGDLRSAMRTANPGEIVGPLETPRGWYLAKLQGVRPASVTPLSQVRESLIAAMRQRKAQDNERRYLDALVAKTPLNVNPSALTRIQDGRTESKDMK